MDADSEATRRKILAVATRHFGAHGYAQTTVKSIAREIGVTSAAIYYHFPSKPHLLERLAATVVEDGVRALRAELAAHRGFANRIEAMLEAIRTRYDAHPDEVKVWLVLAGDASRYPELRAAYDAMVGAYDELFAELVDEAVAAGELEADVDRQAVVDVLVALLTAIIRQLAVPPASMARSVVEAAKLLVHGELLDARARP